MHLPKTAALAIAATLAFPACASGAGGSTPNWVPQQNYATNNEPRPQLTVPNDGLGPAPTAGSSSPTVPAAPPSTSPNVSAPPAPSAAPAADPSVVATKLDQPTGLAVLPDGTALVSERSTGKIFRVQPRPGQPVKLEQTVPGVDPSNGGGLLDLALSPSFSQDGLIYAYLTTATDNRVVHFRLGANPTPVITGIPKGGTDNNGRIAFDATGALLTGTSDAGQPALASSRTSLAGKILRTNDIGQPLPDNPDPKSPVFASGLRTVDGLCVSPGGVRVAISAAGTGPVTPDEINIIQAGADYGWPSAATNSHVPAASLPGSATGGAGCAVAQNQLAIATTTGRSVLSATLNATTVTGLAPTLTGTYGRLRTVVAGSDGALWLTTSNRDGQGTPIPDDDRVIRIDASSSGASKL